jgi:repeat uncharacterized protein DUF346
MHQLQLNRRKSLFAAGLAALAMSILLSLSMTSSARADQSNFCWGRSLSQGINCADPNSRWITAVYGQGQQGTVCTWATQGTGGYLCSDGAGRGIYNDSFDGSRFVQALIYNQAGVQNQVYGTVFYNLSGPPPPPSPPPSWHVGTNLGGAIVGSPDISSWGSGRLDVFARGTNDSLHTDWYSGGWRGWSNLGGPTLASGPGAVSWGSNRIDVVGRASNGNLLHWWYNGISWNSENLGGNIVGDPDIAADGVGVLHVFARGTNDTLQHKWFANNTWSGWESLGGTLVSGPGAVTAGRVIHIVGRTSNDSVTHWWYDGSWHSGENLGGIIVGDPDISSWGAGRIDVFARGGNDYLHHKWYVEGSGWSSWENLGGPLLSSGPGAVSWGVDRIDVVGRGTDGSTAHWWFGP